MWYVHAGASVATFWPPNHNLIEASILGVTDPDGDPVSIQIEGIMSDEATRGLGDGDTSLDVSFGGAGLMASLRAERSGNGPGRTYTINVRCTDTFGNHT